MQDLHQHMFVHVLFREVGIRMQVALPSEAQELKPLTHVHEVLRVPI